MSIKRNSRLARGRVPASLERQIKVSLSLVFLSELSLLSITPRRLRWRVDSAWPFMIDFYNKRPMECEIAKRSSDDLSSRVLVLPLNLTTPLVCRTRNYTERAGLSFVN